MAGKGSPLPRNHSTGDSPESSLLHKPTPEDKEKGYLYPVDNEVVDDLRRITRAYAKKIGGLPIIFVLPIREYQKKDRPQLEDSVLVEDLEELVEAASQEVYQPLNKLDPSSPFQTPVQSQLHSPLRIMANVNANQPPLQPAWRARSPLNLTPPLHDLPQDFDKMLPKFEPIDDHLQIFYLAVEGLRAGEHEDVVCRLFSHTLKGKTT